MYETRAMASCRNLLRTPNKLFVRSGPCISWSFKDISLNLAGQFTTTLNLAGLRGWKTTWWGKYHRGLSITSSCSSGSWCSTWHYPGTLTTKSSISYIAFSSSTDMASLVLLSVSTKSVFQNFSTLLKKVSSWLFLPSSKRTWNIFLNTDITKSGKL